MTPGPGSGAVPARRWHDLDALRAFAMLLGIGLHAALSLYPTFWPVTDATADMDGYFDEFVLAVHGFRMPLFFMLSGFFTVLLWRRRGLRDLLWHRSRRVVMPFIVAVVLIAPTVTWVSDQGVASQLAEDGDVTMMVYMGSRDGVRSAVDAGADVDAPGGDGDTPLYAAAVTGDLEMISLLLELGADPNITHSEGMPIDVAIYFGHADAADMLLAAGSYDPRPAGSDWQALAYWAQEDVASLGLPDPDAPQPPPLHHLWFLWFLILFLLLFAPVAWATQRLEARRPSDAPPRRWKRWLMWALMPAVLLPQLAMDGGGAIPAFGPDTSIGWVVDPVVFGYYLLFFTFGALLHGRLGRSGAPIVDTVGRRWWLYLPGAAMVYLVALWTTFELTPTSEVSLELVNASLQVLYAWLMIFGLMGLFRAAFSAERYWVRYLSEAAYWMYLTHLTLVIALQLWVQSWEVAPLVKFTFIVLTTCVVLLVLYELFVRYTPIGTTLNGKRTRPPGSRSWWERLGLRSGRPATSEQE